MLHCLVCELHASAPCLAFPLPSPSFFLPSTFVWAELTATATAAAPLNAGPLAALVFCFPPAPSPLVLSFGTELDMKCTFSMKRVKEVSSLADALT